MKICRVCKKKLPADSFTKNCRRKDGLDTRCKICWHEYYCYYAKTHRNYINECGKKTKTKVKSNVFSYYSNGTIKCKQCNEMELDLLTIDHINGGGGEHRRKEGISGPGYNFYRWLKRNSYPEGFQVLCWNCQYKKRVEEVKTKNPTKIQIRQRNYNQSIKIECIKHYGTVCPCGVDDWDLLTLDHVNDDGVKHRKELSVRGGHNFYFYLRNNGFPNDPPLQVLCLNCQYRKVNRKYDEERKSRQAANHQSTAVAI